MSEDRLEKLTYKVRRKTKSERWDRDAMPITVAKNDEDPKIDGEHFKGDVAVLGTDCG